MRSINQPITYEFDHEGHLVREEDESDQEYVLRTAKVLHQEGLSSNDPAVVAAQYDEPDDGSGGGEASTIKITALEPDTANVGDPDVTVYVTGTGFTDQCVATFGGDEEPTTLVNAETLSFLAKTSTLTVAGDYPVTVKLGEEESSDLTFTVTGA
jgi:IPT/TIG domain